MIRRTVKKVGKQLEQLSNRGINLGTAFDIMSRKASSIEEIVVVEVMREVYGEIEETGTSHHSQVSSSTLSAKMPSMALSR